MDLAPEQQQSLSLLSLFKESLSIPKRSPQTFYRITLSLLLPLSFAILAHSVFTHPILSQLHENPSASHASQWIKLLFYQFCYLIFLVAFSLLSTSAVVFTVASLYTSKQVSFSSIITALPSILRRLFITFIWVFLSMLAYNAVLSFFIVLMLIAFESVLMLIAFESKSKNSVALFLVSVFLLSVFFLVVHVYLSALWHLASVITVLEPIQGLTAFKKSYELLKGKIRMAFVLVLGYLVIFGVISSAFGSIVVDGGANKDHEGYSVFARIVVGGILIGVLVVVILVGLLVQSLFYYVCKSYHNERIEKSALYNHLGGYLGEYYEPLKGNMQIDDSLEVEMNGGETARSFL
ncbi:hypothetical protein H5410_012396 [Solanum commersonii]|uniref:Polyadenylate-binding protein 1-B-binding protein n=1 Tax=Solanum commersonii TaxID=4109 RepID=A0A9J6ASI5_SOLCO|nr:hypothetical protein H5410_012396 [Solanum commersonii]